MIKKFLFLRLLIIFFSLSAIVSPLFAADFYWEEVEQITKTDSRFPSSVSNENRSAIFWQDVDSKNHQIWLSCQIYENNNQWTTLNRFAGPFNYSGETPDIYSAAIQPDGKIAVAVLSDVRNISVYVCEVNSYSFTGRTLPPQSQPLVAPRLYAASNNSFMLFTSLGANESFSMLYAKSSDGYNWQGFESFAPTANSLNPFVPVLTTANGFDYVVFQSQYNSGTRLSYQLYSTYSENNGEIWSEPVLITGEGSLLSDSRGAFQNYNNQRPSLYVSDRKIFVAWERTYYTSENAHIWVQSLDMSGAQFGDVQELTTSGNANRPILFKFDNTLSLVWFDTRNGSESVFLSQKTGYLWEESALSSGSGSSVFAFPVITDRNKTLSFIWQYNSTRKNSIPYISRLSPDRTVQKPVLTGISFNNGARGRSSTQQTRVRLPADSSGIAGFSWVWTQDKYEMPGEELMRLPNQTSLSVSADEEGLWYFRVRALDYAGNWSEPAEISYYKDTTPPRKPTILPFETDSFGFAKTNAFNFAWEPDELDDDVAGYTWSIVQLSTIPRRFAEYKNHPKSSSDEDTTAYLASLVETQTENLKVSAPPRRVLGTRKSISYSNYSNGLYAFSVAAVDVVGNIGEPTIVLAATNKFIPFTLITSADYKTNLFGNNSLTIYGQGFNYDGTVTQIYVDRDGKEPYDYTYYLNNKDYSVDSNTVIKNLVLGGDVREGRYRIGLVHSDRGLYFSGSILSVQQNGTVKIESEYVYEPEWIPVTRKMLLDVEVGSLLLWIICALAVIGAVFAVRGIIQTAREGVVVRYEVRALLTGDIMALEKKNKLAIAKKHRGSLRVKLMAFTILLVISIVILVSAALGTRMIKTQGQTLAEGLENRISVLLNSLSTGARTYLPSRNVLELSYLPSQSDALSEAEFATITGLSLNGNNETLDYVWATNDSQIASKIDTNALSYGQSRLTDTDIQAIAKQCSELDTQAESLIGEIASQISSLTNEGVRLALRTDQASVARREEISTITTQLNSRVTQILDQLSNEGTSSFPVFDNTHLDSSITEYLFYKPVLYRQGSDNKYVHGIIFLKVSTEILLKSINDASRLIIISSLSSALLAAILGSIGAFILATVIVSPIKVLEKHVSIIGATRDKSKLVNEKIDFKSNDEIGNLRDAVNTMTAELVRAAMEEQLALDGRAVQQAFLPLDTNSEGGKATTAVLKDKFLESFGYYEGASGVSGDYFDYKKLDDRWFVFIKCDASGHGVPAALIMTVVATFFRRYFDGWTFKTKGTRLNELLSQINDFIESLGLRGKFAAIILTLIDTQTGTVYMANAGDNLVHIYDDKNHKMKLLTLPEAPAAGPMPTFMVDMKGGFKIEKTLLQKGDILFLYTDGIEESTRLCRNSDFSIVQRSEKDANGVEKLVNVNELMEPERIMQIIEAVMNHGSFTLTKEHNPVPNETLRFDFSTCQGTIEEVITALISVEKVFRMYKPSTATVNDVVRVDRKIDAFLASHFNLYNTYCSQKNDGAADASYIYYTNLLEDEQLDDLTLVAVRRQ